MSYTQHIGCRNDLITTPAAIRSGFVALALEKNRQATPIVEQARTLKVLSTKAKTPKDLLEIDSIQSPMLSAAGFSEKALSQIDEKAKKEGLIGLIETYLEPAETDFVEELVYRFLLTRGDSLGGTMRNIAGRLAERKLTRAIISSLLLTNTQFQWLDNISKSWISDNNDAADIEVKLKAIYWESKRGSRTLIYNKNIPLVGKNIDISLLRCSPNELKQETYRNPEIFIAFGELKGGIDPAGADEHWKTAQTALTRIREAFVSKNLFPELFFIGAVIVESMAQEIWKHLQEGFLINAANMTQSDQIASISNWLVDL